MVTQQRLEDNINKYKMKKLTTSEPNGNTTTIRRGTINSPNTERQKAQYYGGLIKGREKTIFE